MPIERWTRWANGARTVWSSLERDWRSVAVGALIVASVGVLDLQIPW